MTLEALPHHLQHHLRKIYNNTLSLVHIQVGRYWISIWFNNPTLQDSGTTNNLCWWHSLTILLGTWCINQNPTDKSGKKNSHNKPQTGIYCLTCLRYLQSPTNGKMWEIQLQNPTAGRARFCQAQQKLQLSYIITVCNHTYTHPGKYPKWQREVLEVPNLVCKLS